MNKIELFNMAFGFVFIVIGLWTAMSWMHKQLYIIKMAHKFKINLLKSNIKISIFEAFWRVSDWIKPAKVICPRFHGQFKRLI